MSWTRGGAAAVGLAAAAGLLAPTTGRAQLEISPVVGLYASFWLNSASGATIVLVETAVFVVALIAARRPALGPVRQPPAA